MDHVPGTVPPETQADSLPSKSSQKSILFFLLLGIIAAFVFFPERTKDFLKQVDIVQQITDIPQPTPLVLAVNSYLVTNETENISVGVQDQINLEFKLNRNASNRLEVSNTDVLEEEKTLSFDPAKSVFVGTIKAISTGESVITVNENGLNQILKIKVTVTEKSSR